MYECVSDVLLHLDRMLGIVFMVQRGKIWPKNEKMCFYKMYQSVLREVPLRPSRCAAAHIFSFFAHIWPLWTMKTIPNILSRCNKTSEAHFFIFGHIRRKEKTIPNILSRCNKTSEKHSYIWWTVPLKTTSLACFPFLNHFHSFANPCVI